MGRVEEIAKNHGIVDIREFSNYLCRYADWTDLDSLAKAYIEHIEIYGWIR